MPPGRAPPGTQALTSKERDLQLHLTFILSHSSSYHSAPFSHPGLQPSHRPVTLVGIIPQRSILQQAHRPHKQPRCHYCGNSRTGTHRTAQFPVPTACDPAVPRPHSIDRLITPATNFPDLTSTISAYQPTPFPPSPLSHVAYLPSLVVRRLADFCRSLYNRRGRQPDQLNIAICCTASRQRAADSQARLRRHRSRRTRSRPHSSPSPERDRLLCRKPSTSSDHTRDNSQT